MGPIYFFHIWQVWKYYGKIMAIIFHTMEIFFMEILWIWKKFIWPYYGRNRIFHNFPYYGKNFHSMENLWRSISHKFPYHIFFTSCASKDKKLARLATIVTLSCVASLSASKHAMLFLKFASPEFSYPSAIFSILTYHFY